jgi:23S rRNA pseudouridine1911/1915/1917 synthase
VDLIVDHAERLDKFLTSALVSHSRSKLADLIKEGLVTVDSRVRKASFMLEPGMTVTLDEPGDAAPHDLTPADIPLEIVYEDEVMLVVNKPRGLATHPAASLKEPSLVNALLSRSHSLSGVGGEFRPGIVHRLDKETTGLLVIAKTDAAHVALARQIESKTAERRYFAVVHGIPEQDKFKIDAPIARDKRNRQKMAIEATGRRAITHVKMIKRVDAGSLLALRLETGRTHQIRVHLSAIGRPVVGDATYGNRDDKGTAMQLHAAYLALDHPITKARIATYAAPPQDFLGLEACSREVIEEW